MRGRVLYQQRRVSWWNLLHALWAKTFPDGKALSGSHPKLECNFASQFYKLFKFCQAYHFAAFAFLDKELTLSEWAACVLFLQKPFHRRTHIWRCYVCLECGKAPAELRFMLRRWTRRLRELHTQRLTRTICIHLKPFEIRQRIGTCATWWMMSDVIIFIVPILLSPLDYVTSTKKKYVSLRKYAVWAEISPEWWPARDGPTFFVS